MAGNSRDTSANQDRGTTRTATWALLFAAALATLSCARTAQVAGDSTPPPRGGTVNLVSNPGFETGTPDQRGPEIWFPTEIPETRSHVKFSWEDQIVHSGGRAVSIHILGTHPDRDIAYNWTQPLTNWEVGKTYEIRGWVKAQDLNNPPFVVVQCWNEPRREMLGFATTERQGRPLGDAEWTEVQTEFSVPEETTEVRVRIGIASPDNIGGKVWFDDIRATEIGDAPPSA